MTKREFVQQIIFELAKKESSAMEARFWPDHRWTGLSLQIESIQMIADRIDSEKPNFFDKPQ